MKKWFVIYTKPNFERKVSFELENKGIESYCPLYKTVSQYSDRKKKIEKVLIPSYVFVKVNERERNSVFSVNGVLRYLFWLGQPAEVKENEINRMKNYLVGEFYNCSTRTLNSSYTIPHGPFRNEKGRVIELNKNKIKLAIESLGVIVTLNRLIA